MLLPVGPGDIGALVALLHQALVERGLPVPPDELGSQSYGHGTVATVKDFQTKSALTVDGVAGPKTIAALNALADQGPATSPPIRTEHLPPFVAKLLEVADREYRMPVLEQPPGSNRGERVDMYLVGHRGDGVWLRDFTKQPDGNYFGAPWCGRFALWCVEEAAMLLGMQPPTYGWGDLASAAKWRGKASVAGCFDWNPAPGTIGTIITGGHGHVVIVVDVDTEGAITTREGNSGNRVAARTRSVKEFAGFVHLEGKAKGLGL